MPTLWAGIDAGKRTHHCVVLDRDGTVVLSKKVSNDETELLDLIATVLAIDDGEVCWATDLTDGGAALLIALLAAHEQQLLYLPGRIVHHAAATYRDDAKTDAKDARIIADQARMRTDLQPVRITTEIAVDLRLLTSHRLDVIHDRVRAINRLRATMLEYFPALERVFLAADDYEIAKRFGTQSGESIDKFAGLAVDEGPGGVPTLTAIANRLIVERLTLVDDGSDHVCLSTTVLSSREVDFRPLRLSQVNHLQAGHETEERAVSPRQSA